MGDIAGLAANIAALGLLHPIVVQPDGTLIAGERRLQAVQRWARPRFRSLSSTSTTSCAASSPRTPTAKISRCRRPSPSSASSNRWRRQRQRSGWLRAASAKGRASCPPLPRGVPVTRPPRRPTLPARTLEKAEAVVAAAEAEPRAFGKLLADMDRTGRANGPFKRLRVMKQAELIRAEPPPLPGNGPYRGGMVDLPWAYEPDDDVDTSQRAALQYPTMTIEQACALDVGSIMHQDAVLGFWVTNYILVQGLHIPVLRAWDFESKTMVTWPKDHPGRGHWLKGQTEHLVIATRGNPIVTLTDQTTLLQGPFHLVRKGAHSSKPVEAYTFFKSLCPAPRYADLFSRYQHNDKWDPHGDQAPVDLDEIPEFLRRVPG